MFVATKFHWKHVFVCVALLFSAGCVQKKGINDPMAGSASPKQPASAPTPTYTADANEGCGFYLASDDVIKGMNILKRKVVHLDGVKNPYWTLIDGVGDTAIYDNKVIKSNYEGVVGIYENSGIRQFSRALDKIEADAVILANLEKTTNKVVRGRLDLDPSTAVTKEHIDQVLKQDFKGRGYLQQLIEDSTNLSKSLDADLGRLDDVGVKFLQANKGRSKNVAVQNWKIGDEFSDVRRNAARYLTATENIDKAIQAPIRSNVSVDSPNMPKGMYDADEWAVDLYKAEPTVFTKKNLLIGGAAVLAAGAAAGIYMYVNNKNKGKPGSLQLTSCK